MNEDSITPSPLPDGGGSSPRPPGNSAEVAPGLFSIHFDRNLWDEVEALGFGGFEPTANMPLTRPQWVAVAHMALGKAAQLDRGDYGTAGEGDGVNPTEWAADLRSIAATIEAEFKGRYADINLPIGMAGPMGLKAITAAAGVAVGLLDYIGRLMSDQAEGEDFEAHRIWHTDRGMIQGALSLLKAATERAEIRLDDEEAANTEERAGTAEATREYRVQWEIDVDGASPQEAAENALPMLKDPTALPVLDIWRVSRRGERIGPIVRVDMEQQKPIEALTGLEAARLRAERGNG